MSSLYNSNNNDENANEALTLKQPSLASSSDENLSSLSSSFERRVWNDLGPPMGQSSDEEDHKETNECDEPSMYQPSDLEVESTEGTVDSVDSTSSWYLPRGFMALLKAKQQMNLSPLEFKKGDLNPTNRSPKTLNDGSPDTASTVLCNADSLPDFSPNESSDDDTIRQFSPPLKKQKTLDDDLDSDSSDDDRKESVLERNIRQKCEDEDAICAVLFERGQELQRKARKVSRSGHLTRASPSRLFDDDSDDSNSPFGLAMLPKCFVKHASIPWPLATNNHPEVIANDETDDDS